MIAGIGVDVVSITRVRAVYARWGERFVKRIFSAQERARLPEVTTARVRRLALGLAAKEALSKALGTGLRWPVSWHQIVLTRTPQGAPQYQFNSPLGKFIAGKGVARVHLTLSDDSDLAVAMTVLEK